ncbi:MAG TPA: creatininase family protein [Phycisphaerae bacterium]|nr:creatininase family protein [Phycisphaerae bacterium]HOJ73760.1 creatininase family protein [Phycisphaerae bacterium]HOM50407.1 creatininase family protein [Phycisphaerae bacterium]HON65693.1 creatininase family protein [Phycisphaerae bacterium]HOQ84181.1 creatininase family protein [Phycisphaerae bacterium]
MSKGLILVAISLTATAALAGGSSQYERMTAAERREAIRKHPVAFIPAGINEWHGEQSACGLDALKAETLAQVAARTLGGVCFPTVWMGADASTPFDPAKYPRGTVTIDKANYDAAAEQILTDIEAMGFKVAVYLSGHYPGVVPEVAEKFNQRGGMKVITLSENLVVEGMPAGDHAGAWETSVLMFLRPGLVDLNRLPPLPATTRPAGDVIPPAHEFRQRTELYGIYQLDPRVWANEFYGRRGAEAVIDGLARVVGEALGDAQYGRIRGPIAWPKYEPLSPEVRYDHLLPQQWMHRFEQAPVVYVPVTPADETIAATTRLSMEWARRTGGMVFPPISYAPAAAKETVGMSPDAYAAVLSEIVADLADMDFRVITLVAPASLSPAVRERIAAIRAPDDQSVVVVADASGQVPDAVLDAVARMIPAHNARVLELKSPWLVSGRDTLFDLTEDVYGPGDKRTYEYELTCSAEDCAGAALLDLGNVQNHCEVTLNDGPVMTDHWPPFRFVVTGQLRPGVNRLRITVAHKPQAGLDYFFYRVAPPRMTGPVTLKLWQP